MVFSSVPVYLDPNNWQQQPTNPPGNVNNNHQNHSQLPLPSQTTQVNESAASPNASSGLRPSSMADRARQAKLPQPEQVLMRCPRCDSTNTKFCYFNNYSLSQPRHFCKTCRRYWTRGGALRNVPVGGGCRRTNKRISSISKSSGTSEQLMRQTISHNSSTSNNSTSFTTTSDQTLGHMTPQSQPQYPHQLPFTSSNLHHFTNPMEMNFSGEMLPSSFSQVGVGLIEHDMDDFMGSTYRGVGGCGSGYGSRGGGGNILSSGGGEQWKLPQMHHFPFLAGLLEPPLGLYPFQGDYQGGLLENMSHQVRTRPSASSVIVSQLGSVKMEENQAASLNLSRQLVGMSNNHSYNQGQGNDQYWSGNAWKDVSGLTSSSTTHLL